MEEKIFKADAKQIVDMAFDNKLFKEEITRDDFNGFEDLIQYLLQSRFDSYQRVEKLMAKIEGRKEAKNITSNLPVMRSVFIVQGENLLLHGCFDNRDKAEKFIGTSSTMRIQEVNVG